MDGGPALRLGTVMLGVREMERSVAFYRDALGLAVQFASAEFSFLAAGGATLALRSAAGLEQAGDPRWSELVFHVEDVDAAYRELMGRGVAFRVEPRIVTGDQLAADFRDPDGHVLSILGARRGGREVR